MASRREKKEEYLAAPAIVGETSLLAAYLEELETRHAVTFVLLHAAHAAACTMLVIMMLDSLCLTVFSWLPICSP